MYVPLRMNVNLRKRWKVLSLTIELYLLIVLKILGEFSQGISNLVLSPPDITTALEKNNTLDSDDGEKF